MIEPIVNKIINKGLDNFEKRYSTEKDLTQIRVYFNEKTGTVKYDASVNWKPQTEVSFKEILNKKIDIMGYEQLSTPVFGKALLLFADKLDFPLESESIFIFRRNKKIYLAIYNGSEHIHTTSLSETLPFLLA